MPGHDRAYTRPLNSSSPFPPPFFSTGDARVLPLRFSRISGLRLFSGAIIGRRAEEHGIFGNEGDFFFFLERVICERGWKDL